MQLRGNASLPPSAFFKVTTGPSRILAASIPAAVEAAWAEARRRNSTGEVTPLPSDEGRKAAASRQGTVRKRRGGAARAPPAAAALDSGRTEKREFQPASEPRRARRT